MVLRSHEGPESSQPLSLQMYIVPKELCSRLAQPSSPLPDHASELKAWLLHAHHVVYFLHIFPFPECHMVGVILYVAFSVFFFF